MMIMPRTFARSFSLELTPCHSRFPDSPRSRASLERKASTGVGAGTGRA